MIATIKPSQLKGTVVANPSKSAVQRAYALALLNNGTTQIHNPGESNDELVALDIVKRCGATVNKKDGLVISSNGIVDPHENIHCGESGLALRMFAPIISISNKKITLTGEGSLLSRPVHLFNSFLPELGVEISTNAGYLPIIIQGPLNPKDITVEGSDSSQYITGLLFALAKAATKDITLTVTGLTSRPYIGLSLHMLQHFGYSVTSENLTDFEIKPVPLMRRNIIYDAEGDWSGAAFQLVAGAIAGYVQVTGLDIRSEQGDKAILDILKSCGAHISIEEKVVSIGKPAGLRRFEFDATQCPDLFPPLVALASCCSGVSNIKGVSRLLNKESNRAESLKDVFAAMGIEIKLDHDMMRITGSPIRQAHIDSHNDHRIAMAASIAALIADGEVVITGVEAVNKSYPLFFTHLQMLGADVSLVT